MEHICQTCLVTGIHINPMSAEHMECYRLFVPKMEDRLDIMYICLNCKGILNKLSRFIKQCRLADQLLNSCTSISETLERINSIHLSMSETICHYFGPETDLKSKSDDKLSDDDDDNDNDDDIPMVKFSQNCDDYECNTYDDHAASDNQSTDNIKHETNTRRKQKKSRKKKQEARQGFSSRMVIETEEYTVIKLTLEEIKEEMKQQSNSQKYKVMPYKCEKCVRGFNFEDVLQSHMEKHSPKNGPFLCEICTQYCPSRVSLRGHMKSHSTRYKCKLCGLVRLSRQHILEHYSLQHTGSAALYSCPKCDHTTNKRTAMQRHVRVHSASEPQKCHYCEKYYKTKESLRIHIMKHDAKKLHQCEICSSTFIYAVQLTKHMQAVHVLKDYYCVECDIMFKSMNNLKQHLHRAKRHRDDSSYKFHCTECPQKFISLSTLATHRTHAHGVVKSEACALCPRAYSSAEALRWHTRRAHSTVQSVKLPCPLCDKTFSRKYVLRAHVRAHTGERPHACDCGAAFAQPAALRAHRNAHKKPTAASAENLEHMKNET